MQYAFPCDYAQHFGIGEGLSKSTWSSCFDGAAQAGWISALRSIGITQKVQLASLLLEIANSELIQQCEHGIGIALRNRRLGVISNSRGSCSAAYYGYAIRASNSPLEVAANNS